MWKLYKITAENLCAFKKLEYELKQGCTTLVFGNNKDNDSQGSNGSGKSAMLEAVAIGLTGEPLRKIKMEEIINDSEEEAEIALQLFNVTTSEYMEIVRKFSRKSAQVIEIYKQKDMNTQQVVQAGVADYNKYILEEIGLTKDDIYSNYVLSKSKFQSFLSSSDREKKEIINRFSNGILVDKSIEILDKDVEKINEELIDTEKRQAVADGRIDALTQQIAQIRQDVQNKNLQKAARIEEYKMNIASKRSEIRRDRSYIEELKGTIDKLKDAMASIKDMSNSDISTCYNRLVSLLADCELSLSEDYEKTALTHKRDLKDLQYSASELDKKLNGLQHSLQLATKEKETMEESYKEYHEQESEKMKEVTSMIDGLLEDIRNYESKLEQFKKNRKNVQGAIADLENKLSGTIVCPKCKYEFVLDEDIDVEEAKKQIADHQNEIESLDTGIANTQKAIDDCIVEGKSHRECQKKYKQNLEDFQKRVDSSVANLRTAKNAVNDCMYEIDSISHKIKQTQLKVDGIIDRMFQDADDAITERITKLNCSCKLAEINIKNSEGAIQSYEETIEELNNTSNELMIDNLTETIQKYEKERDVIAAQLGEIKNNKFVCDTQKSVFTSFKTHLANMKIAALNTITNEFLSAIGSDIQIALSGYTLLKSGKVRDKISISLLRDGIDCGSFDKFSAGERARVELATILAMHKLTNITCEGGKGLDLLILDEILEAVDEQGLDNIFKALNNLGITSLVVSHGNIAEGYPYRTVVAKQNGVSYIEEAPVND